MERTDAMSEGNGLPRGLKGLRKLAGDAYCDLWGVLFKDNESDWDVDVDSRGSLCDTLSRLADEIESKRPAITEAERRVLETWPRFEDGEPVMPGDELLCFTTRRQTVKSVDVYDGFTMLHTKDNRWIKCQVGERVKRPAPEVLDADGVPIKVGDTVWKKDIASGVVVSVDAASPMHTVRYVDANGDEFRDAAMHLTHVRPDSWERLEKDAREFARDNQLPHDVGQMERDALDLIRRAKKLAGVES